MIHKPTSTQDQRGTKRPLGKMQKNMPRAPYWMTARIFATSPTTQSGCTATSASEKDEVMPEHPKATRTNETKSPIPSCDLRQKMMAPTTRKTREAASTSVKVEAR